MTVPKLPDIDGVDSFAGITMHTARWDHSRDLTDKSVAIIGTGASAVQVIPGDRTNRQAAQRLSAHADLVLAEIRRAHSRARARGDADLPAASSSSGWLSQAYVELTFPIAAQYARVFPLAKRGEKLGRAYLRACRSRIRWSETS